MQLDLSKNILSTIVYYDCLDYPMTAFEIWKYLLTISLAMPDLAKPDNSQFPIPNENADSRKCSLIEVIGELEKEDLKKIIEEYCGFYFLKGRQELVSKRLENNKISEEKLKIIRRVVWFLRFVPFMRMAAITGRVAMKNAEKSSDLDLLIVLKHRRIFTGRILTTFLVHFLGKRRYGKKIKDRICLNYFITTKSPEISSQDLFSSSEYFFARPVFGFKVFRKFQIKNGWIKNYRPNYSLSDLAETCLVKDSFFSKKIRKAGEKIFGFKVLENMLKNWQMKRIAKDPRTHQAGSMVEANDNALIFLPEPQGPEVFERFQGKLEELAIA